MKKAIIAAAIVAVAALTTLTVSSKTKTTAHTDLTKSTKVELSNTGFSSQKNDISSID
jgi:maltose-binding protein MalE